MSGFPAFRLPSFPVSRLPGFPASRLPGFPVSSTPRLNHSPGQPDYRPRSVILNHSLILALTRNRINLASSVRQDQTSHLNLVSIRLDQNQFRLPPLRRRHIPHQLCSQIQHKQILQQVVHFHQPDSSLPLLSPKGTFQISPATKSWVTSGHPCELKVRPNSTPPWLQNHIVVLFLGSHIGNIEVQML